MEELRSTEILDKEIHEDARKKAERILLKADEECEKIKDSVKDRINKIKQEKEIVYAEKIEIIKRDSEASIPLEQQRFLVAFKNNSILKFINDYLQKLDSEKQLQLIKKLLLRYKNIIADKSFNITVINFEIQEIKNLLESVFEKNNIKEYTKFSDTINKQNTKVVINKGLILETTDGNIKCRATFEELINELLDKYSYELTNTLFCGGFTK